PARFEVLMRNPYLIVDSAHNPDSAQKLKKTILDYLPDRKIILVFGASEDKDVKRMFDELLPGVEHVITTQSIHPRAYNSMDLAELANHYVNDVKATSSVEEALKVAFELAGQDSAIVITGSIFVAAAGKEAWQKNFETRNQ
ncbi:MAG: bifunctional folylpolyglutamate synthase/dihydrofolate synthase, partial [Anaerolineaceae bacterium]|nr:bifunctional folylpolyglutamate synthase/dihydrofolate synthase [Anaerolineaceae bacterium]